MEYFFYVAPYINDPKSELVKKLWLSGYSFSDGGDCYYAKGTIKISLADLTKGIVRVGILQQNKQDLGQVIEMLNPTKVIDAYLHPVDVQTLLKNR